MERSCDTPLQKSQLLDGNNSMSVFGAVISGAGRCPAHRAVRCCMCSPLHFRMGPQRVRSKAVQFSPYLMQFSTSLTKRTTSWTCWRGTGCTCVRRMQTAACRGRAVTSGPPRPLARRSQDTDSACACVNCIRATMLVRATTLEPAACHFGDAQSHAHHAGMAAAYHGAAPYAKDGLLFLHGRSPYVMGEATSNPLALRWKDATCSRWPIDTNPDGSVLTDQHVVWPLAPTSPH